MHPKTIIALILALIAFAGNSILARMALLGPVIDAYSFTFIRIVSGALILFLLTRKSGFWQYGSWTGAAYLLIYAICFAAAYLSLPTGLGALILFASVQLTMISAAILQKERISTLQGLGLLLAIGGLVYLFSPSLERPPLFGAVLMAIAGLGWGLYSLKGRGQSRPIEATSSNFARAAALIIPLSALAYAGYAAAGPDTSVISLSAQGVIYALLSGVVTSGLGYVLWYIALQSISRISASIAQLSVPIIAALLGAVILSEPITLHFVISSAIILFAIGLYAVSTKEAKNS